MRGGLLVTSMAWLASLACVAVFAWRSGGSLTHGEAWFLVAGALNVGTVVVGTVLLRRVPRQPPSRLGGGTTSVVRLLDDIPPYEREVLRREDDLLQRTVAAKMAIELDEPQLALDALEPVIRFLSSSATRSLRGDLSPRPSALP